MKCAVAKDSFLSAFLFSVEVDCEGDNYDENGIVSERYVCHIVSVFIPDRATLHLHPLPIILPHGHLHNILVALVFFQGQKGIFGVDTQLTGQCVLPILFVCLSLLLSPAVLLTLTRFRRVILIRLLLILRRLLHSSIALLVRPDQFRDELFNGGPGLGWSELGLEGRTNLILRLGFGSVLL